MKSNFVNKIIKYKQNQNLNCKITPIDNTPVYEYKNNQNNVYDNSSQYYFYGNIYVNNLSIVINYNLSNAELKYVNKQNHVVIPWEYLTSNNNQQLIDYLLTLNFDFKYYTYIDKNILPKYRQMIYDIGLNPI